jgi:hypothetical protein
MLLKYLSFRIVHGTIPQRGTGYHISGKLQKRKPDCTVSPTVFGGKGFGRFDVQSSLEQSSADGGKLGRVVLWNTVGQFHLGKWFWPEVEDNASFYHGGPNDGRTQNFVTPGFLLGKFKLRPELSNRQALFFGGGVQIATSHFHTYNHALVFTARMIF